MHTALQDASRAEAAAALAQLVELMQARRGLGLDLPSLLTLRHLSRMWSFRCGAPAGTQQSMELESRADELHAETRKGSSDEIAFLEWCIERVLGEMQATLARPAARSVDLCKSRPGWESSYRTAADRAAD